MMPDGNAERDLLCLAQRCAQCVVVQGQCGLAPYAP
jgi:hypothetical protein